jgi:hypothetical protein
MLGHRGFKPKKPPVAVPCNCPAAPAVGYNLPGMPAPRPLRKRGFPLFFALRAADGGLFIQTLSRRRRGPSFLPSTLHPTLPCRPPALAITSRTRKDNISLVDFFSSIPFNPPLKSQDSSAQNGISSPKPVFPVLGVTYLLSILFARA